MFTSDTGTSLNKNNKKRNAVNVRHNHKYKTLFTLEQKFPDS